MMTLFNRSIVRTSCLLASVAGLLAGTSAVLPTLSKAIAQEAPQRRDPCVETVQADSQLSRAELRQLLRLPRGSAKTEVTAALGEPYCRLQAVEVELPDGSLRTIQREAYPFDFAPQTWFVVMYSDDRYLAYDYSFPQ
jgi:hypothetical protein